MPELFKYQYYHLLPFHLDSFRYCAAKHGSLISNKNILDPIVHLLCVFLLLYWSSDQFASAKWLLPCLISIAIIYYSCLYIYVVMVCSMNLYYEILLWSFFQHVHRTIIVLINFIHASLSHNFNTLCYYLVSLLI